MVEDPSVTESALASWHKGLLAWAGEVGAPVPRPLQAGLPADGGPPRHDHVLFGDSQGERLWHHWGDIPGASARDALLVMVSTQADCHMGGVELQASVLPQAPTPEDEAALRALVEDDLEAAAALGALLIRHFPKRGVIAAEGLLTRRALQGTRILNAFNHPLGHWVDLMCFVTFVNLCGSMSLQAMAVGGFAPVAAVTERLVHRHARRARLGTWQLSRIVEAGRVEPALLQKYVNQWVALSLDLFGWDRSRTAALAYAAGLKGRVHERERSDVPEDPTRLNDDARVRWLFLVEETLASLNEVSVAGPPLRVPPLAANRSLVADRSAGRGAPPADPRPESRDWPLPTPADDERLRQITSQAGWIKRA